MNFIQVWFTGYVSPTKFIGAIKQEPAPLWGLIAVLVRTAFDSLLLYLPLHLMGRAPTTPSYLTFVSLERYYWALTLFVPFFFLAQWLLLGTAVHVILCLANTKSDIDQILNITGMSSLVIGAVLLLWDWMWIAFGWHNDVFLGVTHLLFDIWLIHLVAVGFHRILGLPYRKSIGLGFLMIILGLPMAILFMRAPV